MWNDIRNRCDELAHNHVVASLIDGHMGWEPKDLALEKHQDIEIALENMAIPVNADASQMKAIYAAANGQSFVLHGPPGTGKSQTITNMIANTLYQGKTVLFVAEKMAALNVVQKRLEAIGLAPFCLELHSNKTNKTTVLASLNRSLEVGRVKAPSDYKEIGDKLHQLRRKLNGFMEGLHQTQSYGDSLYDAISYFEQTMAYKGFITFPRTFLEALTKEQVTVLKDLVQQFQIVTQDVHIYKEHPLHTYGGQDYSLEIKAQLEQDLQQLISLQKETAPHLQQLGIWASELNLNKYHIEFLVQFVALGLSPGTTLIELLRAQNQEAIIEQIQGLITLGQHYLETQTALTQHFDSAVLDYDIDDARLRWKQSEITWFLPKLLQQNKLLKELKLYANSPASITKDNITNFYTTLSSYKQLQDQLLKAPTTITSFMNHLFTDVTTNWDQVTLALEKANKLKKLLDGISFDDRSRYLIALERLEPTYLYHVTPVSTLIEKVNALVATYHLNWSDIDAHEHWIDEINLRCEQYRNHLAELHAIVLFNQLEQQLVDYQLEPVSTGYKEGILTSDNLVPAFTCNFYYGLTLLTISKDDRLADFHGKQYDAIIDQYKETLAHYQQLTMQELVARLSANVPASSTAGAASSELGILKKAIKNNGRMMSLRRLFDQTPTLLRKLTPCMLMSPISVAQYIDPSFAKFDLVIFDEASQLPTSASVGTIARGDNVVIVGDPKQLPPTNFFSSNRIDEENSELEDLESLLDDCLAISMPEETLQWHYRSRHESLIAYSNMKYYDNKLYTFPSPNNLTSAVKIIHLDGYYDKGKTKHNVAEATAIVQEIIRRLSDETLRNASIGVVTFSSVQQHLIEDMLYETLRKYPELEELDQASSEPIFIKNLENVQGDERDVILFSIGYGPDKNGKVSMNFGPLNRDGGWRRLNVAISRARKSMTVYSVLKPEQINLSRTRSEGVASLKGFLEFASRGKNLVIQKEERIPKKPDHVVLDIIDSLKEMGYASKHHVGCSAFKVDIGVVHPNRPDHYVLGILLDGENYNESSTARDRFLQQPGVLQGLGWNILRIWTMDWLDNPEKVKQQLQETIEKSISKGKTEIITTKKIELPLTFEQIDREASPSHEYAVHTLSLMGSSDDFYLESSIPTIRSTIQEILSVEAPINQKLLFRKVLDLWGISRSGSKVSSIFSDILSQIKTQVTTDEDRIFLWNIEQIPEAYEGYRVETSDRIKRNMDDIPSQEIYNAITEVLNEQISLSESDLVREVAKKFGYLRLGIIIENTILFAIKQGITANRFQVIGNGNIGL